MKKSYASVFIAFLLLLGVFSVSAQTGSPIALGQWREHIPYNRAISLADTPDKIYCASVYGLYSYSKSTGELNLYSRLNGLSDFEISKIRYNSEKKILFIAYQSSNIDLILSDNSIVNLSDIKRKNIVGGKKINDITFLGDEAYLCCEFGIVVVDLKRMEIKDTYYIGVNGKSVNVNGLSTDGTYLLAACDSGIYKAQISDPNIFNYTAWNKDTVMYEPNANFTSTTSFAGKFFVVKTNDANNLDSLFVFNNNRWDPFIADGLEGATVDSYNNYLLYRTNSKIGAYNAAGVLQRSMNNYFYNNARIISGFYDPSGDIFWVADYNNGLVKITYNPNHGEFLVPNGPQSEANWAMDCKNGDLWVASGSLNGDAPAYNQVNGTYHFTDSRWTTFNKSTDSLYDYCATHFGPALVAVAVDPTDSKHAYIGGWGGGVLEYRSDGGVQVFNESNSEVHEYTGINGYIITGGLTFDKDNNLWVVSGGNPKPLAVRHTDGSWESFVIPSAEFTGFGLYQILVDDYNQKWIIAREGASTGQGIGVFNENDAANPNDNSFKRIYSDVGKGGLPDMFVRAMAKDKDGAIWVGTNKGVAVFYNPGNVFSGNNFDAQKIIIQQDGYNQYLLETEFVTSIVVDGANRKWFGTYSGGVFLMSADGTKQLLHFTTENSPLPSNSINAIAIDDISGEVFFGTEKGIISYKGDATEGKEYCSDYFVYPNPVKHDYSGPIAVRGLVENADVKITDVSGTLVYHTKANGGQAIWYGTNFSGERVQTGVYTVFITNEDGSQTCTTKVLFAN
ncbi:MAG TPA: two-component regulator propeller domain-containing protein [Bacteroidia bacterium]|nr:two-component regulator propeller domain-containing protein [Bacteroidia bacterium]HNP97551.1 two-component regulator propeller domain-containing protein [Bacteroidia bacterium]